MAAIVTEQIVVEAIKKLFTALTNPSYNLCAQGVHALLGATAVLTAAHFGVDRVVASVLIIACAAGKEFWFDLNYERPEVSGGIKGGIRDFSFYLVGIVYANLVLWI